MNNEEKLDEWEDIWSKNSLGNKIVHLGRLFYNKFFINLLTHHINKATEMAELGCGTATIGFAVDDKVKHYTGVDFSHESIQKATKKAQALGIKNMTFVEKDALLLGEDLKNKFDLVWSQGIMEFFDSYEKILKAHYDLAKPGGGILIGGPYRYSYIAIWRLLTTSNFLKRFWPWSHKTLPPLSKKGLQNLAETVNPSKIDVFFMPPAILGFLLGIIFVKIRK